MKKTLISLIMAFAAFVAQAQYLSPFGIGTNNPNGTLHLHSSTVIQNSVVPTDEPGGDDPDFDPDPDPHYETILHITNTATGGMVSDGFLIWQYDNNVTLMQKETGNIEIKTTGGNIKLASNGKVGIGTISSGHRLNVDGSARFGGNVVATGSLKVGNGFFCASDGALKVKSLRVTTTDWPDFVFEDGYRLIPIQEVEKYIKANGHLPDLSPANEVEFNGVDLGEMNKMLLQKVEELTLYVIDLQKQIDELKTNK